MELSTFSIRLIETSDIEIIAKIHRAALPLDFCSLLGHDFLLNIYYPQLMLAKDHFGLCAVDSNNQIAGFIFFLKGKNFFQHLFFNYFLKLVGLGMRQILNKQFIAQSISIFALLFLRAQKPQEKDYELNYIAINPDYQGKGIGSRLINEGLKQLTEKNASLCWVKTLTITSENRKFYEKNGFETYDKSFGRTYLCHYLNKNYGM